MQSTINATVATPAVRSAADIERLSWRPVPGCPGVYAKELWRSAACVQSLICYEPGAGTPGRPHREAHQHMWVVAGEATIAGRRLGAGASVNVPARVAHRITDAGPLGCLILQTHTPEMPVTGT